MAGFLFLGFLSKYNGRRKERKYGRKRRRFRMAQCVRLNSCTEYYIHRGAERFP